MSILALHHICAADFAACLPVRPPINLSLLLSLCLVLPRRLAEKDEVPFSAYTEPFEQCVLHPLRPGKLLKKVGPAQEEQGWRVEGRAVLTADVERIRKRKLRMEKGGEGGGHDDETTTDEDGEENAPTYAGNAGSDSSSCDEGAQRTDESCTYTRGGVLACMCLLKL